MTDQRHQDYNAGTESDAHVRALQERIAADGPQYKGYGNSMAVNCMRWLGRRIEMTQ